MYALARSRSIAEYRHRPPAPATLHFKVDHNNRGVGTGGGQGASGPPNNE